LSLQDAEELIVLTHCTNVTDRQTDRPTELS